jgi:Fe-S-cluster containining protein
VQVAMRYASGMSSRRLRAGDRELIQIVDAALADASRRAGEWLACRPGCTHCCIGVFAIHQLDAVRLQQGMAGLEESDPQRTRRIRERARASVGRMSSDYPGNAQTGVLDEGAEADARFEDFANDEPCPVLDPSTGTCDLYSARPILCRTFGPPMRTPEGNLATCELCYIHATTEEIAAFELDPAIPALEAAANKAFNASHNLHGETLVAYALAVNSPKNENPTPAT